MLHRQIAITKFQYNKKKFNLIAGIKNISFYKINFNEITRPCTIFHLNFQGNSNLGLESNVPSIKQRDLWFTDLLHSCHHTAVLNYLSARNKATDMRKRKTHGPNNRIMWLLIHKVKMIHTVFNEHTIRLFVYEFLPPVSPIYCLIPLIRIIGK